MFGDEYFSLLSKTIFILVSMSSNSMAMIGPDLVVETTKGKVQGMNLMTAQGRQAKQRYFTLDGEIVDTRLIELPYRKSAQNGLQTPLERSSNFVLGTAIFFIILIK